MMFLEQIDSMSVTHSDRHCEGRRPVAIQTAFSLASAFQLAEPSPGLPRRFAPRNDEHPLSAATFLTAKTMDRF
jgi:hypothetical protein